MLKIKDLAALLGVSVQTIYRFRSEGRDDLLPPCVMIGAQPRWRRETVEKWLDEREGAGTDAAA